MDRLKQLNVDTNFRHHLLKLVSQEPLWYYESCFQETCNMVCTGWMGWFTVFFSSHPQIFKYSGFRWWMMHMKNFLIIQPPIIILSRASEVGSPTNHLGSRQRRDTSRVSLARHNINQDMNMNVIHTVVDIVIDLVIYWNSLAFSNVASTTCGLLRTGWSGFVEVLNKSPDHSLRRSPQIVDATFPSNTWPTILFATIFKNFIYVCFQLLIFKNENRLKLH